jgi:hypothetical protein
MPHVDADLAISGAYVVIHKGSATGPSVPLMPMLEQAMAQQQARALALREQAAREAGKAPSLHRIGIRRDIQDDKG